MRTMTITEALAEIRTLEKRVAKKREEIQQYLYRQHGIRDEMEDHGGSAAYIEKLEQSIADLLSEHTWIRTEIQRMNLLTVLEIEGIEHTVAQWLVWKREISEGERTHVATITQMMASMRERARRDGVAAVSRETDAEDRKDYILHIDPAAHAERADQLEKVLGLLDGKLTLVNSTTTIDIPTTREERETLFGRV